MKTKYIYKYLLLLFAVAAFIASVYLTYIHYAGATGSFCDISAELSCEIVNQSIFSEVLGIPVSVLGIIYAIAIFWLALKGILHPRRKLEAITFYIALFNAPLAIYFTTVSILLIESICIVCEFFKAMMLLIVLVSYLDVRAKRIALPQQLVVGVLIFSLLAVGITYFLQTRDTVGDTYTTFAQCLDASGMKMYGSVTCAFCAKQRAMFGNAFHYIEEIECDPRNPHPQVELCVAKKISHTPTWILEDDAGNELYRFEAGVQSLEALSEASGCPLTIDTPAE